MRMTVRSVVLLLASACGGGAQAVVPLPGTSWVLESIGGTPAVAGGRATLEFAESGRATGNGSCNRFGGTDTFVRDSLSIGPLMSTKMACVEDALTSQETRYLALLESARRYAVARDTLRIYAAGDAELRFTRAGP
jgi:heat shock protein HslJ